MPFRDQQMQCPRCGKPLAHYPDRDKWRCKTCNGALVGGEQLVVEIGPHAQEVLDGAADPARQALHPCPVCAFPMTPYTIGTIEVDRCVEHRLVWFDGGEIGKIRAEIPAETEHPLFTDAFGFIAQLRADEDAASLVEIPLAEPQAPMTSGEWKARKVCSDGACNGLIVDGKCNECGKLAS
ncbi:MAG: zf-TFIIB domain-containing protein [Deltaproteobacteria bacterium]|nr:zf-TFIIB domain-containing protein [Deltaproteobacteria bacterium]